MLAAVDKRITDWLLFAVALGYTALSLADCLTTSYALTHGGHERNPVAAVLYHAHGMGALVAFKMTVVVLIVVALRFMPRRPALWVGTSFATLMALVVTANMAAIATL